MERVINLFAGASLAREAAAVDQVDTVRLLDDQGATVNCILCLDAATDPVALLECGHLFHASCLDNQAQSGRSECSVCRTPMRLAPIDSLRGLVAWANEPRARMAV
jgi:Zinc finger, C3HC4 type (RING finger)